MATTLAQLLDGIATTARKATGGQHVADDAHFALGHLSSALNRLIADGVGDANPDHARWIREMAQACASVGQSRLPPPASASGRLTQLSGAAADTAALLREEIGHRERWAITVAIADAVPHLTGLAEAGASTPTETRRLVVLDAATTVVSRFAALDPPTAQESRVLDRAVPDPFPALGTPSERIAEEVAGLLHSTRPGTGPHSVATLLAIATSAETVSRAVASTAPDNDLTANGSRRAMTAWAEVRVALTPFNDGSRRQHSGAPPAAVTHALALHRAFDEAAPAETFPAVSQAVRCLPLLAEHMDAAALDSARSGRLLAYACDLPINESRVTSYLAGHHARGLIAADVDDLSEVSKTLRRAGNLSSALANAVNSDSARPEPNTSHAEAPAPEVSRRPPPAAVVSERSRQERADAAAHAAFQAVQSRAMPAPPR